MNDQTPPLGLGDPEILDRSPEPGRMIRTPLAVVETRHVKAVELQQQLAPIRRRLGRLTDAQRRAFFVKLRHSGPVDLTGTGLKAFSPASDNVTLAVAQDGLERLERKIESFGTEPVRKGIVPNASLVGRLEEIAPGNPLDRLSDELFAGFDDYVRRDYLSLELEIISLGRGRRQRRDEIKESLQAISDFLGNGARGTVFEHEEQDGSCRLVVGCTGAAFRSLVISERWQTSIVWFELPPDFETFHQTLNNFSIDSLGSFSPPNGGGIVCVVDSGVLPGNAFLQPITRLDLMRSFLKERADDVNDQLGHGSGVASLVSYHALNLAGGATNQGACWIASARILDENDELNDRLVSVVLEEVVKTFVPLGLKIFNLSVNIRNRPWNKSTRRIHPKRSWTARTIDRLAREHDVLFIVSVGNLAINTVGSLHAQQPYPGYFTSDVCSILDPAQAALAISVGSLAASTQIVGVAGQMTALAEQEQPSPFTRIGPGIRGETKPELVEYGGNLALDHGLGRVRENPGMNVAVASHHLSPAIAMSFGTSLAAPRVSHHAARILEDLLSLGVSPSSPLLRAFLVSSAEYPQSQNFTTALDALPPNTEYRNVVGYGIPSAFRATYCDDFSVAMYYQGKLSANKVALFDIPVPESLINAGRAPKTLSVTVAFDPEVHHRGFGDYFGTTLRWRLFRGDVDRESVVALMSKPDEDTGDDPEPDYERGSRPRIDLLGVNGIQRRSRGSVQPDTERWDDHNAEFSRNHYLLAVTTFEKWGRTNPPDTPYAVVVRLAEHAQRVAIYDHIALALDVSVPVRA
jgi:hypothetical protein